MELLSRFELETSSLPILLILFPLVVPWFVLTSEAIALQRLRMFSYFVLVYHAVRFYDIIFGARMGFVWVSIQTQIWNGLLFDISPTAPISDPSPPPLQGNALAISRNQRYNENNIPISTLNQAEQKGSIIITYRKPLSIFELNEKGDTMENLNRLVNELCKLPNEIQWVEFKHNNYNPAMIGQDISALANSAALYDKSCAYML